MAREEFPEVTDFSKRELSILKAEKKLLDREKLIINSVEKNKSIILEAENMTPLITLFKELGDCIRYQLTYIEYNLKQMTKDIAISQIRRTGKIPLITLGPLASEKKIVYYLRKMRRMITAVQNQIIVIQAELMTLHNSYKLQAEPDDMIEIGDNEKPAEITLKTRKKIMDNINRIMKGVENKDKKLAKLQKLSDVNLNMQRLKLS
jgi:hypothetical protein